MIFIDNREGSEYLVAPLTRVGLPVESVRMDSGDLAFEGKGEAGTLLNIGIEFKTLSDLVASLRSGRLNEQRNRMLGPDGAYDYAWLLIEGRWRTGSDGVVETYYLNSRKRWAWKPLEGRITASEMQKQVLTLELCGGFYVRYCNTRHDSLQFIVDVYHWWHDRPLDAHTSHLRAHTTPLFIPISDFRDAIQRYPGIGLRSSLAVEKHFQANLRRATHAGVEEWAGIEVIGVRGKTKRIGVKVAEQIVQFCGGKT